MRAMRASTLRGRALLSLCGWLLSGCLTQMLSFHVEVDHVDDHHHESGLLPLVHHPDAEGDHDPQQVALEHPSLFPRMLLVGTAREDGEDVEQPELRRIL